MNKASKNQIKLLRKLSQKKYREKEGAFIAEGERAVEQLLVNKSISISSIYVDDKNHDFNQLIRLFNNNDAVFSIDEKILNELSDTDNPQGIMALANIPDETPIQELANQKGLIVAVDRMQDPGNLGTIIRTATWFGCKGFILGRGSVDMFHPKVVRSTVGATGELAYTTSNLTEDLTKLEKAGWVICFLDGNEGAKSIKLIPKHSKMVVVIGNEANGVNPLLFSENRLRALIPASTENRSVESLNAAIAGSIGLYELALRITE